MPDQTDGEIRAAGAVVWREAASPARRPAGGLAPAEGPPVRVPADGRPAGGVRPGAVPPAGAPPGGTAGIEVALVHRPKYDDWTLPKGKCEPGEHVLMAAVREVAEETGQEVILGRRLSPAFYTVEGRPKRVDYWAGRAVSPDAPFVPCHEVDALAWLPMGEAADRLTYERDVALLEEFAGGPALTVPLILLRHASAGSKAAWAGADLARPLDARGAADADRLARLLRCFGAGRVISSAAERCVATVRPYAALTAAKIEIEPAFTVGAAVSAETVVQHAAGLADLALREGPVTVCAHRENLPLLITAACARLNARPPGGRPLRKGRFWVLHVAAGGVLAGTERHHPAVH
jgi:8-oxo-dGTP pyrophosphatase MutT (NUDIX family)/phosphohistidine phosphatase SixA